MFSFCPSVCPPTHNQYRAYCSFSLNGHVVVVSFIWFCLFVCFCLFRLVWLNVKSAKIWPELAWAWSKDVECRCGCRERNNGVSFNCGPFQKYCFFSFSAYLLDCFNENFNFLWAYMLFLYPFIIDSFGDFTFLLLNYISHVWNGTKWKCYEYEFC